MGPSCILCGSTDRKYIDVEPDDGYVRKVCLTCALLIRSLVSAYAEHYPDEARAAYDLAVKA